jgi:hypothetical protein
MKSTSQSALPTNRAFIVQLRADAEVGQRELSGRVEHLVSMRATHFHSVEELVVFIVQVVTALQTDEEETEEE